MTTTQQITPATIAYDARKVVTTAAPVQRYSVERDSFVCLSREGELFVMTDARSGSRHQLFVNVSDEARLTAHWAGFLASHKANC